MRKFFCLNFSPALFKGKINIKFLLAYLKTLTNSKNCSVRRIKFLFQLSFALIGGFSLLYNHGQPSVSQVAFEQLLESQAAFGKPENFFYKKQPKIVKTISTHKITVLICNTFQKIIHLATLSL
jgi:hypothetical protein